MICRTSSRTLFACLAALALAGLFCPTAAHARLAARLAAKAGGPTQAPVQAPIQAPGKYACDPPCIAYKSHRFLHCKFDPCNTTKVLLPVTDPCTCCTYNVPVCIPCCCDEAPAVSCQRGHFGRDVVEYSWCCGYRVRVVFEKCGDITVHTYGL